MPVAGKVSLLEVAARSATTEHTVTIADATGGTFRLGFHSGDQTDALAYDVSAIGLEAALEGLTGITGSVTVAEDGGVYDISYARADGADGLLVTDDSLTGEGASITLESDLYDAFVPVKGRVDWNFNVDKTEIDGSHMDIDDGWSLYLQGRKNCTLTGTLRYIEDDPGQEILVAGAFADDQDNLRVRFRFQDAAETPDIYESFGFVTNLNPTAPDEDVTNMSFSLRLDAVDVN